MTMSRFFGLISVFVLLLPGKGIAQNEDTRFVARSVNCLTDVIIRDITSPPVASRDYAYSLIAFYEAVRPCDTVYKSYAGQLNGLKPFPTIMPGAVYDWLVAGTAAFHKTAYFFVFSKEQFQQSWDSIAMEVSKRNVPADVMKRSVQFGEQVADHVIQWAKEDNYIQTRGLQRFTPSNTLGTWQQTGPDYMEAVEPYWNRIRPMTLSRPDEFLLPRPAAFNSEKFIKECNEVAETGNTLSKEQRGIASFWDCNPFAVQTVGHLMYSIKKISPGGHWIGIAGVVIRQKKQNLIEALHTYSLVSVAIFDGFIAAWDEKYRSNYIRPVTAIQKEMMPTWEPLLQTPPFPEYPSAHSVVSMASATVLTRLYGDNFSYTDDVEEPFGLAPRSFHSFVEAASEAAISRMYGGIHFREAIENGKDLGRNVGNNVLKKLASIIDTK